MSIDKNLEAYWENILENNGLGNIDIQLGIGEEVDDILDGKKTKIEEVKKHLAVNIQNSSHAEGKSGNMTFCYKDVPIGEMNFIYTDNKALVQTIVSANGEVENTSHSLLNCRQKLWGRQTKISGLGTYMLECLIDHFKKQGIKNISFVYEDTSKGFYENVLPKCMEKYGGKYFLGGKTCEITLG